MTERPILFAGPMVRRILADAKWQTRRVIKLTGRQREWEADFSECPGATITNGWVQFDHPKGGPYTAVPLRWRPGDRAWVRESGHLLREAYSHEPGVGDLYRDAGFQHSADGAIVPARSYDTPIEEWIDDCARVAKPSIHMPRWASRITLEITDVRVQRLQDISEEDARAEGIAWDPCNEGWHVEDCTFFHGNDPRRTFEMLWSSIHGPGAWDANPWVCALSFRRVERQGGANG